MKSDIPFTNQFKKDLKLAKKQNKNLDKLFDALLQKFFTKQSFADALPIKPDRLIHIRRFPVLRHGAPPPFSFV